MTIYLRPEVLKAVKMSIVVFSVVTPCGLVGGYHVLEERNASIYRAEERVLGSLFLVNKLSTVASPQKLTELQFSWR
jgi:hypothetical protein